MKATCQYGNETQGAYPVESFEAILTILKSLKILVYELYITFECTEHDRALENVENFIQTQN